MSPAQDALHRGNLWLLDAGSLAAFASTIGGHLPWLLGLIGTTLGCVWYCILIGDWLSHRRVRHTPEKNDAADC